MKETSTLLRTIQGVAVGAALVFGSAYVAPSHAVLMETTFSGEVTEDNGGNNPFGLAVGAMVSGVAQWDDDDIVGAGPEEVALFGLANWEFTITLGSFTFGSDDVTDPGFSAFFFENGDFDGIQFFIEPIDIGAFTNLSVEDSGGGRSLIVRDSGVANPEVYLEVDWDLANATTVVVGPGPDPVPEPAPLALMALGLLGFLAVRGLRVS